MVHCHWLAVTCSMVICVAQCKHTYSLSTLLCLSVCLSICLSVCLSACTVCVCVGEQPVSGSAYLLNRASNTQVAYVLRDPPGQATHKHQSTQQHHVLYSYACAVLCF